MPTIPSARMPQPPVGSEEFEEITLSAVKLRWNNKDFFRNGRSGQAQCGVDIFCVLRADFIIGIQCKNMPNGLRLDVVQDEIIDAGKFKPRLSMLYIATSAHHDAKLQEQVRHISTQRQKAGEFGVELLFWRDIVNDLAKDPNEFFKHYAYLRPLAEPAPRPGDHERRVFDAEELAIKRHPVLQGRSLSIATLKKLGAIAYGIAIVGLIALNTKMAASSSALIVLLPMTLVSFGVGMVALETSSKVEKSRFTHLLLRRCYLEATQTNQLHLNRLSATCPWCGTSMTLLHTRFQDRSTSDDFVCERNPEQHTIRLDPTGLPELP